MPSIPLLFKKIKFDCALIDPLKLAGNYLIAFNFFNRFYDFISRSICDNVYIAIPFVFYKNIT